MPKPAVVDVCSLIAKSCRNTLTQHSKNWEGSGVLRLDVIVSFLNVTERRMGAAISRTTLKRVVEKVRSLFFREGAHNVEYLMPLKQVTLEARLSLESFGIHGIAADIIGTRPIE